MTDPTPPHDQECREQRKFEALVQTATNSQLLQMINDRDLPLWKVAAAHAELGRRGL